MAEYDSARALAERLIKKKGRTVTIVKVTDTPVTPDAEARPWEPDAVQEVEDTVDVPAVVLDSKRSLIDDTLVSIVEKKAYIATQVTGASDIEINLKDLLIDGNRRYRIDEKEELRPGGQSILFILGLNGA